MATRRAKPGRPAKAPARGKRARNKEKTKRAILQAALELFRKKGFHRTTTKEITARAGIAEGTLFNYFPTKEDLALCFFEEVLAGLIAWYQQQDDLRGASLPEKLFAVIHRHLERLGPYEEFIGAVYLRALQPSSKLSPLSLDRREINLRYLKFIRGIFAESHARGEIPRVAEPMAYGFGLFHLAMIAYWLHDDSPGKEKTLALLDRCSRLAATFLRRGKWEW